MPLFGFTRVNSANKREVESTLRELALIGKDLWRQPIDNRKILIKSMRLLCEVPEDQDDLHPKTLERIRNKEGVQTQTAFIDAVRWVRYAEEFLVLNGERTLDRLNENHSMEALDRDLDKINDYTSEYLKEEGTSALCQELFDARLNGEMPRLSAAYLSLVAAFFECNIQSRVDSDGHDCHWGKCFPDQYKSYLNYIKEGNETERKQHLLQILAQALIDGSADFGKSLSE